MSELPRKPGCMVPIFSVVVWVVIVGVICAIEADKTWQSGKQPHTIQGTGITGLADPIASGTLKVSELPPPEPDYVQQLRRVTEKRKLSFKVYCYETSRKPDTDNFAIAWSSAGKFGKWLSEDGAVPQWITSGRTQEIAIRRLLNALLGPPTWTPRHRQEYTDKPERKRECPPPIEGGPQ